MTGEPNNATACIDGERLNAFVDGEASPDDAAHVRDHMRSCAGCLAEVRKLTTLNQGLHALSGEAAPIGLWQSIADRIDASEPPGVPGPLLDRRTVIAASIAAAAIAVSAVIILPRQQSVATALVDDFVTYRDRGWTVDLAANDKRTLAAWGQSRVLFAVPELKQSIGDLEIAAIRLCSLLTRRLIGLTYARGEERAVIYIMEAHGLSLPETDRTLPSGARAAVQYVKGHGVAVWSEHDLAFVLVAADRAFARLVKNPT